MAKDIYGRVFIPSFFLRCEEVFNPSLGSIPSLIVDEKTEKIIDSSALAKCLGYIPSQHFSPHKDTEEQLLILPPNYELYEDFISRLWSLIGQYCDVKHYGEPGSFLLRFEGIPSKKAYMLSKVLIEKVYQALGIPTIICLGPTSVISSVGIHPVSLKKGSVYRLFDQGDIDNALRDTAIEFIFGERSHISECLRSHGIQTALELKETSATWSSRMFGSLVTSVIEELNGTPSLEFLSSGEKKKSFSFQKDFQTPITSLENFNEEFLKLSSYGATKLQEENIRASNLLVYVCAQGHEQQSYTNASSRFVNTLPSFQKEIFYLSMELLKNIYLPGYSYTKAGLILTNRTKEKRPTFNLEQKRTPIGLSPLAIEESYEQRGESDLSPNNSLTSSYLSNGCRAYTTSWGDLAMVK